MYQGHHQKCFSFPLILCEVIDEILQWLHLLLVHQVKFAYEIIEVLEARIQVRLFAQAHDFVKVRVVNVCVHSEEPLEDLLDDIAEVLRERYV